MTTRISPCATALLAGLALAGVGCTEMRTPAPAMTLTGCRQWTSFPANPYSNEDSPYLGCSNTMNLRAMAANPADLDAGRPLGPADGEHAANAVAAYRQGRVKSSAAAGGMVPSMPATAGGSAGGQ